MGNVCSRRAFLSVTPALHRLKYRNSSSPYKGERKASKEIRNRQMFPGIKQWPVNRHYVTPAFKYTSKGVGHAHRFNIIHTFTHSHIDYSTEENQILSLNCPLSIPQLQEHSHIELHASIQPAMQLKGSLMAGMLMLAFIMMLPAQCPLISNISYPLASLLFHTGRYTGLSCTARLFMLPSCALSVQMEVMQPSLRPC